MGYSERIIMLKIKAIPRDMVLVQVYERTTGYQGERVEGVCIYEQIEKVHIETEDWANLNILGYWNTVVGEGEERDTVGEHGLGNRNVRGSKF